MSNDIVMKYCADIGERIRSVKNAYPQELILFRGQTNEDYPLTPSLFRIPRESWFEYDQMHFLKASHFVNVENELEIAIHAQHYGYPTRLLDVSYNCLIGLFFACYDPLGKNLNRNGVVSVISNPKYLPPTSPELQKLYKDIIFDKKLFDLLEFYNSPIVIENVKNNDRIIAQHGAFLMFINEKQKCKFRKVTVDSIDKPKVLSDLDCFFNINEGTVFPDIEKNVDTFKSKHSSSKYEGRISFDIKDDIIEYNIYKLLERFHQSLVITEKDKHRLIFERYKIKLDHFLISCYKNYKGTEKEKIRLLTLQKMEKIYNEV